MTKITIIGDVHGCFEQYLNIIKDAQYSIQVGDFGFATEWKKLVDFNIDPHRHKIVLGNHEDYHGIRREYALKDYGYINWYVGSDFKEPITHENAWFKFFTVRGAYSIDRDFRTIGIDWWPQEELSHEELAKAINLYEKVKPEIVICHECPKNVSAQLFRLLNVHSTRTTMAMDAMFGIHKPKIWIFGHWHESIAEYINGTLFVCLPPLARITYEIDENIGNDIPWNQFNIREQIILKKWKRYTLAN